MSQLSEAITRYGERSVNEIVADFTSKGKVASGRMTESLRFELIQVPDSLTFILQFFAEEYALYVSQGRRPGTWPNITALKEWMDIKGIEPKYLYPIAKRIYLSGIIPSYTLDDVFNENTYKELAGKLKGEVIEELRKQVKLLFAQVQANK